jgi:aspartyl-tRNA(Asn)/glutamyl-tRNA(Gln) amidotransferase subunit B
MAAQLAFDAELAAYFERALEAADGPGARAIANWVTGELIGALREAGEGEDPTASRVSPQALAALVAMVESRSVTTGNARSVLARLVAEGGDPADVVAKEGLGQLQDAAELEGIVERAVADNADAAERVRSGNAKAIGPIVGQVMRETRGRADGGEVTRLIHEKLGLR